MNWRIYRLPGSREIWYIDSGCGTPIFNVRSWQSAESRSVDIGGNHRVRAWIEIENQDLHIVNGHAIFEINGVFDSMRETLDVVGMKDADLTLRLS